MTQRSIPYVAVLALLFLAIDVDAKGPLTIEPTISKLVAESGLGARVGIHVVRLSDGYELYNSRADEPANPASNLKLLTAAAALRRLGPSFAVKTSAHGKVAHGHVETLVIVARGDPTLTYVKLVELAESLRLKGIDSVDKILIDDRYFDEKILPPAFDQQPEEAASFRAAVAAFSVDRNSYTVSVRPGPRPGTPGIVRVLAEQAVELDNATVTRDRGASRIYIDHQVGPNGRLRVRVYGGISNRGQGLKFRRRVPEPKAYAASLLARAFRSAGVGGALDVAYGTTDEPLPLLVETSSPPLSEMLHGVGKWSDNFTAEMVLKIMGAEAEQPGSSTRGALVVREELAKMGVDSEDMVIVNGSGLFHGNRVSPRQVTEVLRAAYLDPAIRPEYVAQLAVGGDDGTLRKRLTELPNPRMVRAKTGTLRDVIALSGYVLGDPQRSLAFSFLANDVGGRQMQARRLADEIVAVLADYVADDAPMAAAGGAQ